MNICHLTKKRRSPMQLRQRILWKKCEIVARFQGNFLPVWSFFFFLISPNCCVSIARCSTYSHDVFAPVAAAVPFAACAASEPHHIPILLSGSDRWHFVVFLFSQGGGGGRSTPGRSRHSLVWSFSTRVFPAVHVPGTSSNFLSSLIPSPPPLSSSIFFRCWLVGAFPTLHK